MAFTRTPRPLHSVLNSRVICAMEPMPILYPTECGDAGERADVYNTPLPCCQHAFPRLLAATETSDYQRLYDALHLVQIGFFRPGEQTFSSIPFK
jgi:hypothetical protein